MPPHDQHHSGWSEDCGCELSPSCEMHRAAADLGAALQAAVLALSARMPFTGTEPAHYFIRDPIGREIAAALHKAGLLLLEMPSPWKDPPARNSRTERVPDSRAQPRAPSRWG
jgi:hypothetical protein